MNLISKNIWRLTALLFVPLALPVSLHAEDYKLTIGDIQVTSDNANNIFSSGGGEGTASFTISNDAATGEELYTLTLNNATIYDYQEAAVVLFSYPKLTVRLIGVNHIVNGFRYTGSTPETGAVEFTSDGGEENCLIFDSAETIDQFNGNGETNTGFFNCTYNTLSDETGWTLGKDVFNKLKLYKKAITTYGLSVAGIEVTSENASDITGNETNEGTPQVVFDPETNTLTLTEAQISIYEAVPLMESSLSDLTIVLQGGRSDVWWNNVPTYPDAVFVISNNDANLTFSTSDGSSLYINDNITLFTGIETATYEGGLMLKQNDDWSAIQPVAQPSLYVSFTEDEVGNQVYALEINSENGESTDYYYSIDYADESLEDVPTTKAEVNGNGYVSDIVLMGPCTVTAYAQVGDAKSAEKVGKLFGFETTQVKATYGTESVALPAIVPSIDESIEVYYSPGDETIATESDGVILLGQKIGSTSLYANLQMPDIMPDYEILNTEGMVGEISVTILPPMPSVDLAEGTYNEAQEMTVSSNLPNTVSYEMHYYRETAGVLASDSVLYGNTLRVDATCKLYLYTRAMNEEGVSFYSDTLSLSYTIIPPTVLNISYADNSREWATYCASERNLETPEGLQAYIVTEIGQSEVAVEAIDYIPQGVGILLQCTVQVSEPITAKAYLGTEANISNNLLTGTTEATKVESISDDVYVLYDGEFVKTKDGSIPANRAYLSMPSASASARLKISFLGDTTTGIAEMNDSPFIMNNDIYDLQGRRIRSAEGGLYIKNGRKIMIR